MEQLEPVGLSTLSGSFIRVFALFYSFVLKTDVLHALFVFLFFFRVIRLRSAGVEWSGVQWAQGDVRILCGEDEAEAEA